MGLRILYGLLFVFASVSFFMMKEMPPPPTPEMGTFMTGLMASKYFLYLLKITELVCGLLLMANFYAPLALVILSPIVINIFFTHLFLAPSGLPLAIVMVIVHCTLAYWYKDYYKPLLRRK